MKITIGRSENGALSEFLKLTNGNGSQTTPNHFRILDASTPVPNCRAAEVFMAVWAARWIPVQLSTDVTMSGTVGEHASEWDIDPPDEDMLRPWFDFYSDATPNPKGFPSFVRNPRLRGFAPLALANNVSPIVLQKRMERFSEVANLFGISDIEKRVSVVDFGSDADISFGKLIESVPFGKTVGRFPCPACSLNEPVYHAIRRSSRTFIVTRPGSMHLTECLKCKGVAAWKRADLNVVLRELIRQTGFVVNGMAAFVAIDKTLSREDGVVMRDYSNPRGIAKFAHGLWSGRLKISTRLTIRDKQEEDIGWELFRQTLEKDYAHFVEIINTIPALSDGRTVDITI